MRWIRGLAKIGLILALAGCGSKDSSPVAPPPFVPSHGRKELYRR